VNVKLTHSEVVVACKEWLAKHFGIIALDTHLTYITNGGRPAQATVQIEFPGIEPIEAKPEMPPRVALRLV
jgi:hypothetical protein